MYYVLFSCAEDIEQVYMESFTKKIKANEKSLAENQKLVERSIVPSYRNIHFCLFMVNIQSLENKLIDLEQDIFAQKSDHIIIVETWIKKNKKSNVNISGRLVRFLVLLQNKGKKIMFCQLEVAKSHLQVYSS